MIPTFEPRVARIVVGGGDRSAREPSAGVSLSAALSPRWRSPGYQCGESTLRLPQKRTLAPAGSCLDESVASFDQIKAKLSGG